MATSEAARNAMTSGLKRAQAASDLSRAFDPDQVGPKAPIARQRLAQLRRNRIKYRSPESRRQITSYWVASQSKLKPSSLTSSTHKY
jgi:hypothetical protein